MNTTQAEAISNKMLYEFIRFLEHHSFIPLLTIVMIIIMIITIIVMWVLTQRQIREMRKIEDDKVLVAINSLIAEIEYNNILTAGYIEHAVKGANVIPNKEGVVSYELNKPSLGAYARYLIIACKGKLDLSRKITALYNKLEACKTSIEIVHNFVAANAISAHTVKDALESYNAEISYCNNNLSAISKDAQGMIPDLINKLEALK
jgi:hypothetical protein